MNVRELKNSPDFKLLIKIQAGFSLDVEEITRLKCRSVWIHTDWRDWGIGLDFRCMFPRMVHNINYRDNK